MEISHSGMQKVKLSALSDLHSHRGALSVVGEFGKNSLQYNNPLKSSCFSTLFSSLKNKVLLFILQQKSRHPYLT